MTTPPGSAPPHSAVLTDMAESTPLAPYETLAPYEKPELIHYGSVAVVTAGFDEHSGDLALAES